MQLLTNSRMSCARTCLRKHEIRYEHGLRLDVETAPRRIGSAFHRAMELDALGQDGIAAVREFGLDPYDLVFTEALVTAHRWRYEHEPLEVVAVELPFELPLLNPETGTATPIWNRAGKIDAIVRLQDGRLAILERKTTSEDISLSSDYWIRVRIDQQNVGYFLAARELGFDVQTVMYDVIRKPGIQPKKATPPESRKFTKDGALYANQRAEDETPAEYGERVSEDLTTDTDRHFVRLEIARLEQDLETFRDEVWQQQLWLRNCQRTGHWFRNTNACKSFFGTCEYLGICDRTDLATHTPEGFVRLSDVHPELSIETKGTA